MSSKSLLSIALFLCINGVLSSKHKHHNKHNKAVEADYSSPLADDQQFADKEFAPKGFFPTSGSKDGALPTLEGHALPTLEKAGDDNALPTFEGQALPTLDALDDAALPTFEGQALPTLEDGALPTPGEDGLFPTLVNKNMNVNVHNNNSSNSSFLTKLLIFSLISAVIAGLYLFYKKRNNSKYVSVSQVRDEESQQFIAVRPAEETTPLIV